MESQKIYPSADELSTINSTVRCPEEGCSSIFMSESNEELSTINSTVRCPEEGCSSIFMSESNLNLHLAKTHKKENLMTPTSVNREYYCPDLSCNYNDAKSFKSLKLLKQHYLKVHSEKTYGCDTCDSKFSTQAAKNRHSEYCHAKFTCCECNSTYPCYESLLTHSRRKQHLILDKTAYRTHAVTKSSSITNLSQKAKKSLVLPKNSTSLQLINVNVRNLVTMEKGSQTDIWTEKPRLSKRSIKLINNSSQETQTLSNKQHLSAETQTIGDYIQRKSSASKIEDDDRKSINTQTKPVNSKTKSCNTLFNLTDFNFMMENTERNHSGTQTTNTVSSEFLYSTSQTETTDLNVFEFMHSSSQTNFNEDMDTFDSENYFNCNSETQTDFMSILNSDYCSNMYTQTCDSLLLNDLAFMNSHTQTVFDDILKSVESQTTMSTQSNAGLGMTCRDMAHMETQTDVEFKQMLEEINA
ncbi:hypothetical protein QE152_g35657 [Popillia japonica]|uniref:C2H2-type domain-containing protein n=1 Tax=Popillia japonica TaxID=7064 RepID=A0AAW1IFB9_POPJA